MSCGIRVEKLIFRNMVGILGSNKFCKKYAFKINGSRMRVCVVNKTSDINNDSFWKFFLIDPDDSIYPFYYTMSVVDQYGHCVCIRKGTVAEQGQCTEVLLGQINEVFLAEKKLIKKDVFTVDFTLTPNCEPTGSSKSWETHSNDFRSFYENKALTDCVIRVKNAQFPVHRAVLAARSTVFLAMFQHDTSERRSGEVHIPDVQASILNLVLYYIYSGKVQGLNTSTASAIFSVADKYALLELRAECLDFLKNNLTMENILEAALLSHMHEESDLMKEVQQFFMEKYEDILESTAWQLFLTKETSFANKLLISVFRASRRKRFRTENKDMSVQTVESIPTPLRVTRSNNHVQLRFDF